MLRRHWEARIGTHVEIGCVYREMVIETVYEDRTAQGEECGEKVAQDGALRHPQGLRLYKRGYACKGREGADREREREREERTQGAG